jgi:hypothetical protein
MISRRRALAGLVHGGVGFAAGGGWLVQLLRAGQARAAEPRDAGAAETWKPRFFTADEAAAMLALVELIIPSTDGPGAREAQAHQFIDALLAESELRVHAPFRLGLTELRAKKDLAAALQELSDRTDARTKGVRIDRHLDAQFAALPELDLEGVSAEERARLEFFVALKSLTAMGYLTSPLFEMQPFHADYAGCTHKEHQ